MFVLLYVLLHVVALALPVFFVLRKYNLLHWRTITLAGFFIASLPLAVLTWPAKYSEGVSYKSWDGHKMSTEVINGHVTQSGWMSYLQGLGQAGIFGVFLAIIFCAVLFGVNKFLRDSKRTSGKD
jgi:hypothetical protein